MPKLYLALLALAAILGCRENAEHPDRYPELDNYLTTYNHEYQRRSYASSLAEWESNTHIVEGDSSNAIHTRRANEDLARFVGSSENISRIQQFLKQRDRLSPLQAR